MLRVSEYDDGAAHARAEKRSMSNVSYKSVERMYGLVVKKVERQAGFGAESEVWEKKWSEDVGDGMVRSVVTHGTPRCNGFGAINDSVFKVESQVYTMETPRKIGEREVEVKNQANNQEDRLYLSEVILRSQMADDEVMSEYCKSEVNYMPIQTPMGTYKGDIVNGKMHGLGQIVDPHNFVVYDGGFKDNTFDGYGVLFNKQNMNANTANSTHIDKEVGFVDLNLVAHNWAKYEGIFKDDKKSKIGYWYFNNGDMYFGEFAEDKAEGYGVYSMADGHKIVGLWKSNKLTEAL